MQDSCRCCIDAAQSELLTSVAYCLAVRAEQTADHDIHICMRDQLVSWSDKVGSDFALQSTVDSLKFKNSTAKSNARDLQQCQLLMPIIANEHDRRQAWDC